MENLRKIIHLSRSQPDIPTSQQAPSGPRRHDDNDSSNSSTSRLRRHRSPGGIGLGLGFRDRRTTMSGTTGKRKEIYKYIAPWPLYSMNWSVRPDKRFRLALGSFVEEYNNKVQIISLDEDTSEFSAKRLVAFFLVFFLLFSLLCFRALDDVDVVIREERSNDDGASMLSSIDFGIFSL